MPWLLTQTPAPSKLTAFSLFHCGGGSSMGYKLAGFEVLGGVEIDPKMSALYVKNLKPKHEFLESIVAFNERPLDAMPDALLKLDLLDGSPPCSTFSIAGSREKAWGKDKKFREGQATQVLDSLPMQWALTVKRLRPKVAVMENVTGMIKGNAKGFVREVIAFLADDYTAQLFQLDASRMGVAQKRERIFIVARRKDLDLKQLALAFNEAPISCEQATQGASIDGRKMTAFLASLWHRTTPGKTLAQAHLKGHAFNRYRLKKDAPAPSITSHSGNDALHWAESRHLSAQEIVRLQSFPDDYNFADQSAHYVCGMSVPPLMAHRLALEIRKQWLDGLQ